MSNIELSVQEACELYQASPATIRRDFNQLVEEGEVVKTWGGIKLPSTSMPLEGLTSSSYRKGVRENEKRKIAEKAASMVVDGDVILIDGGTTTYYMTSFLAAKNIRVITNSILIAHKIDQERQTKFGNAEVFLTGGFIYPGSGLLVGPQAIANIEQYNASKAFLSVGGIDADMVTNSNQLIVESEQAIIQQSEQIIMLADSSKFGKKSMVKLCEMEEIDVLITDYTESNADLIHEIRNKNVLVMEV
ncbi:MAG: DeoR/GlpR transcriptional regulator [Cyclobacteriaceae bacterium]|nr:DeoR/GlpR transcriptional regulator [Cyclobacteriaceae bacterium]